jgi:hypothetical protein
MRLVWLGPRQPFLKIIVLNAENRVIGDSVDT